MGGSPTTGLTPPPAVPDVKETTADKIGNVLGAVSNGGWLGSISDAIARHHQKRQAEANMYHDVMVEKASKLAMTDRSDPEYQKVSDEYALAKQAYAKSAGVDKDIKKQIQQREMLADHHIQTQQAQRKGNPPAAVPAPPSPPSTATPGPQGASAVTPAGATTNPAVPPPPAAPAAMDMTDVMARIPAEQREMADKHALAIDQAKADIQTKAKIAEEEAAAKGKAAKSTPTSDAYFSLLDQVDPKTGEKYTAQEALRIVTQASQKAGRPTPFEEYMSDPKNYEEFQKEMAKAKQTPGKGASIGAVYGIYRMLEMGYKQNPEILPVVAALAPQVFKSAGMEIPPAMAKALGNVPLDQPLSPETGAPIGTSMPGAPTAGTRTQAQTAARIITGDPATGQSPMEEIRKEVKDLSGYLGPGEGRLNVKYLLGKVGSTGDPDKDAKLSKLRTDLTFLASAAAKFHLNSVRAMTEFEKNAEAGKDSSAALGGFLDSVEKWAQAAQRQEQGAGETKGIVPPPSATTRLTSKGRTYNIPNIQVDEFKKDHPDAVAAR